MEEVLKNMSIEEIKEYHSKHGSSMDEERAHSISDMVVVELLRRLCENSEHKEVIQGILKEREERQGKWWWA